MLYRFKYKQKKDSYIWIAGITKWNSICSLQIFFLHFPQHVLDFLSFSFGHKWHLFLTLFNFLFEGSLSPKIMDHVIYIQNLKPEIISINYKHCTKLLGKPLQIITSFSSKFIIFCFWGLRLYRASYKNRKKTKDFTEPETYEYMRSFKRDLYAISHCSMHHLKSIHHDNNHVKRNS